MLNDGAFDDRASENAKEAAKQAASVQSKGLRFSLGSNRRFPPSPPAEKSTARRD
jgi:hypothetical protein